VFYFPPSRLIEVRTLLIPFYGGGGRRGDKSTKYGGGDKGRKAINSGGLRGTKSPSSKKQFPFPLSRGRG
jgi:hypothetical protein